MTDATQTISSRQTVLPDALLFIDGQSCPATGGRMYDNIGPWTGDIVGRAAHASRADVEGAIVAARRAFDTTDWSTNHDMRFALVKKLHELFTANIDRLSAIARHEVGAALLAVNRAQVATCLGSWADLMAVYRAGGNLRPGAGGDPVRRRRRRDPDRQ